MLEKLSFVFLIFVGVISFGLIGCSSAPSVHGKIPCADQSDCDLDEVCRNHYCLSIYDDSNVCNSDSDCGDDLVCKNNLCIWNGGMDGDVDVDNDLDSSVVENKDAEYEQEMNESEEESISCEDGNKCTLDVFEDFTCHHYPANEGEACNDFNAHTSDDKCVNGKCLGVMVESNTCCGDECTDCTKMNTAHGAYKCVESECMLWCDYGYLAAAGVCVPFECNDNNPCTYDGYTEDGHTCLYSPVDNGTECHHVEGLCSYVGICIDSECNNYSLSNCDDGIDCTVDDCDPDTGCSNVPDDSLCPDGNICSVDDGGCVENAGKR